MSDFHLGHSAAVASSLVPLPAAVVEVVEAELRLPLYGDEGLRTWYREER